MYHNVETEIMKHNFIAELARTRLCSYFITFNVLKLLCNICGENYGIADAFDRA